MLIIALAKMGIYYVYIIRSIAFPHKVYTGFTNNLERRLLEHNRKESKYTSNFAPWEVETYLCFREEKLAKAMEKYLKTGSGIAFARKHFLKPSS
jgi:predicted GIY-YIG superfamily endonuclease